MTRGFMTRLVELLAISTSRRQRNLVSVSSADAAPAPSWKADSSSDRLDLQASATAEAKSDGNLHATRSLSIFEYCENQLNG